MEVLCFEEGQLDFWTSVNCYDLKFHVHVEIGLQVTLL